MERILISLAQLILNPAINPRHASDDDVSDLVARIQSNGFTDALWVRWAADGLTFEIIDGSRRYRALQQLQWTDHIPVDVIDADDAKARELALGANVARSDLSPADEAVAFASLRKGGLEVAEIAARFAVPEKRVAQRIAIGTLPEAIITALRDGHISIQTAQAFTLTSSAERQLDVFGSGKNLLAWQVREALTDQSVSGDDVRVRFVGLPDYIAAGGRIDEDLFGGSTYLRDGAILQQLFDARIEATVAELKNDGWSWVKVLEGGNTPTHKYASIPPRGKTEESESQKLARSKAIDELEVLEKELLDLEDSHVELTDAQEERGAELQEMIEAKEKDIEALQVKQPYTTKQKAALGVLIIAPTGRNYNHSSVEILLGRQSLQDKAPPSHAAADDEIDAEADPASPPPPAPVITETAGYSDAVEELLRATAEAATKLGMVHKPALAARMGLAARVCSFLDDCESDSYLGGPFAGHKFHTQGGDKFKVFCTAKALLFHGAASFVDVLAKLETFTPEDITLLEAMMAARLFKVDALKNTDAQTIINLIDATMTAEGFAVDAEFLGRLSRDQLLLISAEITPDAPIKKGKKPEMLEALLPQITASNWLPPQLRTPSYEGPGSEHYKPTPTETEQQAEAA
jgi:ParB/RepB/Spo0J family partition protein